MKIFQDVSMDMNLCHMYIQILVLNRGLYTTKLDRIIYILYN